MAKRSFYVKDSELDDYQVKVINKKTDNSYIVKGCAGESLYLLFGKQNRYWMSIKGVSYMLFIQRH